MLIGLGSRPHGRGGFGESTARVDGVSAAEPRVAQRLHRESTRREGACPSAQAIELVHHRLADDVGFEINPPANLGIAQRGQFQRGWDQRDLEAVFGHRRDRQVVLNGLRALRDNAGRKKRYEDPGARAPETGGTDHDLAGFENWRSTDCRCVGIRETQIKNT